MNPHYHHSPYPEMNSPHSPHSDGAPAGYRGHGHGPPQGPPTANGHIMSLHHDHLHSHPAFTGGGGIPPGHPGGPGTMHHHHPHHHHHHHMINNNNNMGNNNNNNTSNNNQNCGGGNGGGNIKICRGCNMKIMERYLLHALDSFWHNCCLKCSCCGVILVEQGTSCFTKGDMILCRDDYIRIFGNTGACSACGQTIPANELVMRVATPPSLSGGPGGMPQSLSGPHHVFHLKCFACSKCGAQLVSGDRYYLLSGSLVCEQDWHKLLKGSTGVNAAAGTQSATGTTVRKGKVGRPRRPRE